MLALVDDREPPSIHLNLKQFFEVQKIHLAIGDIIVPSPHSTCVIERKTPGDFLSSIADGRLTEQLGNMLAATSAPIFIIEGDIKCNKKQRIVADGRHTRWYYYSYQSMIASLQLAGAIVIHCPSRLFAETVFKIAQWHQKDSHLSNRRVPNLGFKTTFSQQVDLLAAIPGIGVDKAELLLDEFGNPWNVFSNVPDWGKVKGIGAKTIEKVLQFLDYNRSNS